MAYTITLTNGTQLTDLNDSTLDTTTLDITLIGKNTSGYGDALNENFVHLLESFANNAPPSTPLSGQVWWDTATRILKVYDGANTSFKNVSSPAAGSTSPLTPITGDLWWNTSDTKLYAYNGASWVAIGPPLDTAGTGVTTATNLGNALLQFTVNGTILGIFSPNAITTPNPAIPGFSTIGAGLNIASGYKVFGTATDADRLGGVLAADYLRRDQTESISGAYTWTAQAGITIGTTPNRVLRVGVDATTDSVTGTAIISNNSNANLLLAVNQGGTVRNGLYINGTTRNVVMPISASIGTVSISNGNVNSGNNAATLFGSNTTTNITLGTGLTSGTFTLGGTASTGTATLFPSSSAQAINIGTSTTGIITIGGLNASSVQLPTGKTRVGHTILAQGTASQTITFPATTGTLALNNQSMHIGTTSVAINRTSANLALTGISSVTFPGATSGTTLLQASAAAGTTTITMPAVSGTVITTGDTATVTNAMLAGSIVDSKLSTISTANKVANSATTATSANTGNAIVARDASGNFTAGTITAALTGSASQLNGQNASYYLDASNMASGTLSVARGGTGRGTLTAGGFLTGNGTTAVNMTALTGLVYGNGSSVPSAATALQLGTAMATGGARATWSTNGVIDATVGMLAWKNYGNGHVIFDASAGTAPTGAVKNNTNPDIPWTVTYPTLMGWNGTNTYGVRVDSARNAEISTTQAPGTNNTTIATTAFVQAANTSVGVGQTWQNFPQGANPTTQRNITTTLGTHVYTNSTGKPIQVNVSLQYSNGAGTSAAALHGYVGGVMVAYMYNVYFGGGSAAAFVSFIVPPGQTYQCINPGSAGAALSLFNWAELR